MIPNLFRHRAPLAAFLVLFTAGVFWAAAQARQVLRQLPPVHALDRYTPSLITRILDARGEVVSELFIERRSVVPLTHIPIDLQRAVLAIEDDTFYTHPGIDVKGILRAAWANFRQGRTTQGGSTITQQLAKNIFLSQERTLTRKVKELLLTLQIERNFSKEEILQMYLNQIYFGHGAYGVEAAARVFFKKKAGELNLPECATLAGLPKAPQPYSPFNHPDKAVQRRNLVLRRMRELGFITDKEELLALGQRMQIAPSLDKPPPGAYFVEAVRRELEPVYGAEALYREGLTIHTTLDLRLQVAAELAMEKNLTAFDEKFGEQRLDALIHREEDRLKELEKSLVAKKISAEDHQKQRKQALEARDRWRDYQARWRKWKQDPAAYMAALPAEERPPEGKPLEWPEPAPAQTALTAVDPKTGGVRAMVGGRDFQKSQFNRARQARRQPGSAFKPFVWLAALESGETAAGLIKDMPIAYTDMTTHPKLIAEATSYALLSEATSAYYHLNIVPTADPGTEISDFIWSPQSWDHKYLGEITLRRALAWSRNLASVRLTDRVGPATVVEFAQKAGIQSPLDAVLSLGLGSSVVTVEEMTGAFATFANGGTHNPTYLVQRVLDKNGSVLKERSPQGQVAFSPQTSYLMTRLLMAVVQEGTGRAALRLGRPAAGKTGTTQDMRDVWFLGYLPELAAGVWMGHDDFLPLAEHGLTSSRSSVPLWTDFMAEAGKILPTRDFAVPSGIVFEKIDADTGLLAMPFCPRVTLEAFRQDTAPKEYCPVDHEAEETSQAEERAPVDE